LKQQTEIKGKIPKEKGNKKKEKFKKQERKRN
jgi:hypothetical protein